MESCFPNENRFENRRVGELQCLTKEREQFLVQVVVMFENKGLRNRDFHCSSYAFNRIIIINFLNCDWFSTHLFVK